MFRSREVKQSYFTSILTTLIALAHSVFIVAQNRPDIVRNNQTSIYLGYYQRSWNCCPSMLCSFRFVEVAPMEYLLQDSLHRVLLPRHLSFALREAALPHRLKVSEHTKSDINKGLSCIGRNSRQNTRKQYFSRTRSYDNN